MKYLLDNSHIDRSAIDKDALKNAICGGSIEAVQFLLDVGVTLGDESCKDAVYSGNLQMLDFVISKGVPKNPNALSEAIDYRNVKMVRALIERGFEVLDSDAVARRERQGIVCDFGGNEDHITEAKGNVALYGSPVCREIRDILLANVSCT